MVTDDAAKDNECDDDAQTGDNGRGLGCHVCADRPPAIAGRSATFSFPSGRVPKAWFSKQPGLVEALVRTRSAGIRTTPICREPCSS